MPDWWTPRCCRTEAPPNSSTLPRFVRGRLSTQRSMRKNRSTGFCQEHASHKLATRCVPILFLLLRNIDQLSVMYYSMRNFSSFSHELRQRSAPFGVLISRVERVLVHGVGAWVKYKTGFLGTRRSLARLIVGPSFDEAKPRGCFLRRHVILESRISVRCMHVSP